jgi:hypothetical protein
MASMKISNCFSCEGDAHTIGEKLVKPCAVDLTACMVDKEGVRKRKSAPLYDSTIQRRIQDCAANILDELVRRQRLSESFHN